MLHSGGLAAFTAPVTARYEIAKVRTIISLRIVLSVLFWSDFICYSRSLFAKVTKHTQPSKICPIRNVIEGYFGVPSQ